MKTPSLLLTGCVVLCSTMWTGTIAGTVSPTPLGLHSDAASLASVFECGGEPRDAVLRGLRSFLDRPLDGLVGNSRPCAD